MNTLKLRAQFRTAGGTESNNELGAWMKVVSAAKVERGPQQSKYIHVRTVADSISFMIGIRLSLDLVQISKWYQTKGKMLSYLQ